MKKELFIIALTFASLNIRANLDDDVDASDAEVAGINAPHENLKSTSYYDTNTIIADKSTGPMTVRLARNKMRGLTPRIASPEIPASIIEYIERATTPQQENSEEQEQKFIFEEQELIFEEDIEPADCVDFDPTPVHRPIDLEQHYNEENKDSNDYSINRQPVIDDAILSNFLVVPGFIEDAKIRKKMALIIRQARKRQQKRNEIKSDIVKRDRKFRILAKYISTSEEDLLPSRRKVTVSEIADMCKKNISIIKDIPKPYDPRFYTGFKNPLLSEGYFNL